jgi:hypothetical protein
MNTSSCKIIKLSNGEDIVCTIENNELEKECKVSYPLLMQVIPQRTPKGITESLHLSKWVQPFTDSSFFKIKTNNIILVADASPDLCKYYEYVLSKMDEADGCEDEDGLLEEDDIELSIRLATRSDSIH